MLRDTLIDRTINTLSRLPQDKIKEISDFAEFILKKYDEDTLQDGMEKLVSNSNSFEFLKNEETLYSIKDLKVKF